MVDDELRKVDREQLLGEQEVLEELVRLRGWGKDVRYWREELRRVVKLLEGLPEEPLPGPPPERGG